MSPAREDSPSFRPFTAADLPHLARWLREPHVAAWWTMTADEAAFLDRYVARLEPDSPTRMYVIDQGGRPIGKLQACYDRDPADLGPGTVGIDLLIGEPALIGRGLGPVVIDRFVNEIVFAEPTARTAFADPDMRNTRSIRAFVKAGFVEQARLATPDGQAALMVRRRG